MFITVVILPIVLLARVNTRFHREFLQVGIKRKIQQEYTNTYTGNTKDYNASK